MQICLFNKKHLVQGTPMEFTSPTIMLASKKLDWPYTALKDHAEISFPGAEEIPVHPL